MRVELDVDLRPTKLEPEAKVDPVVVAEKRRCASEERRLRRIALARVIEARIDSGELKDIAEAARRCRVSRAQLSKVVAWRG